VPSLALSLKSEAFSRVSNDLKSARMYLSQWLEELSIASQALAQGIEKDVIISRKPDLALIISPDQGDHSEKLYRYINEAVGHSPAQPDKGFITLPCSLIESIGFKFTAVSDNSFCDSGIWYGIISTSQGLKRVPCATILEQSIYGNLSLNRF